MSDNVTELIHAIVTGNAVATETSFQTAMAEKLAPMIDARRIEVAQSLFASQEQVSEEDSQEQD